MGSAFIVIHILMGVIFVFQTVQAINTLFIKKKVKNKKLSILIFISGLVVGLLYIPMVISLEENSYMFLFGAYVLMSSINNKKNRDPQLSN